MLRRTFLTALPTLPLAARSSKPPILAGAYIWTQYYSRQKQRAQDHVDDMCQGFARAGYRDVELMNLFFEPGIEEQTYAALKRHKLACSVAYIGGPVHTPETARVTIDQTMEFARRLKRNVRLRGISFNVGYKSRHAEKTDEELATQARALDDLGRALRGEKLGLYLHQHAPEMANGAREWRHVLKNTDPANVSLCLDVHWILRGGQDVMTLVHEAGPRIGTLHLRNSVNGIWTEDFGDGDIDYRAVAAYLKSLHYRGYLSVELGWDPKTKVTRSLEEDLRLSREYTERVFLGKK